MALMGQTFKSSVSNPELWVRLRQETATSTSRLSTKKISTLAREARLPSSTPRTERLLLLKLKTTLTREALGVSI
jgi:hypothetical protein